MMLQDDNARQAARKRVFISYKHTDPDQKLAMEIYEGLRQHFDVFIDQRIPVGARWAVRINKELSRADFFVVLLSEQAIQSEMVVGEIDVARDLAAVRPGRPRILPVRMAHLNSLPYPQSAYLRYLQWIDWDAPGDTKQVIERLMQSMTSSPEDNRAGQPLPPLPGVSLPADWPPPRGALSSESPYYIERSSEKELCRLIRQQGVTLSIRGPRQVGKTSLLARIANTAREQGKQVVWIDFQLFERGAFTNPHMFYQQLCVRISDELGIEPQFEDHWDATRGDAHNLDLYIRNYVLPNTPNKASIVLAMDEVERVLEADFRADFFRMLHSWHNRRAQAQILRQLDLVLVTSTEPKLWLPDAYGSPFNVGERTILGDFTEANVHELNRRYGSPLRDEQLQRLIALVRGHPYLVHLAIYSLWNNNYDAEHLFEHALNDDGPFADHLNHLLFKLYGKRELSKAMRRIIRRAICRDDNIYYRLQGAGLVRRDDQYQRGRVLPSRKLYADYFYDRLKPIPFWQGL